MLTVEKVFKALGDPVRIKIVELLAINGETCVCKIIERLGMRQPAVSHHLSVLKNAGLVRARRQGQWIHYSLCQNILSETAEAFIKYLLRCTKTAKTSSKCHE